jgi:hypothetical protein
MNRKVVLLEAESSVVSSWTEPFENLLDVVKNTFAQFLNVAVTAVKLVFTFDNKKVFEIIDKYYDRMKSLNAKSSEIMSKIEATSGDMNLFSFVFSPDYVLGARLLAGGPGALRNFIDFYQESTGDSLNPFDIGPPGARDTASLMNNRINYSMGFNYGGAMGGGRGSAPSRNARQIENRLNRAFGISLDPRLMRAPPLRVSGLDRPRPPTATEFYSYGELPILIEAKQDVTTPLTKEEFKIAVEHFMKQVDLEKLGVKSSAKQVEQDMNQMADELAMKFEQPYSLIVSLSAAKTPNEMYGILNEMTKVGFKVSGVEQLKPDRIKQLTDETLLKAEESGKISDLFVTSVVKPKDPKSPTDEEKKAAAQEIVTKTIMSKIVTDSKNQVQSTMASAKQETLKKFDETFMPKNADDKEILMKSEFGNVFKAARSKIENAGIKFQNQIKVDTSP